MLSTPRGIAVRAVLAAGMSLVVATRRAPDQAPAPVSDPATAAIVLRAGRYVEAYEKEFSAVVSEEHQVQKLTGVDGRVHKQRELKSDLALIKAGTSWMQQSFRDVLEVDRKPIRNHDDRLRKLFLDGSKTAVEQAQAVSKESERYNIGISRRGVSPMMPLRIVNPRLASGFRFGQSGAALTFEEFRSPTYLHCSGKDLLSHGSVDVDADTGKVIGVDLKAEGPPCAVSVRVAVRYGEDAQLKLLVPLEMTEEYWKPAKPKDDRLVVTSTYSSFRRFQVKTSEIIK
jgi:hypothetical protein